MTNSIDPHFPLECELCSYNTHKPHLPCSVHPVKPVGDHCPDFHPDSALPDQEWWEPSGASYYGSELVISPVQRWTRSQKMALLDYHPLFTGRCPKCEISIAQTEFPRVHWDCAECGWQDDSI